MTAIPKLKPAPRPARIPPLENGAQLTAAEFLRRYEAMPGVKKAELIEGIVHMPSPVRVTQHGEPDNLLQTWLGTFAAFTPGAISASNSTIKFDIENTPQPDAALFLEHGPDGRERLDEEGYLVLAPELVVEIAASSASIDMHAKLRVYRRSGVREYLVWLVEEERIVWFDFAEGETTELRPDARGRIASRVFPGLVLDTRAALARDAARVLSTLQAAMKRRTPRPRRKRKS